MKYRLYEFDYEDQRDNYYEDDGYDPGGHPSEEDYDAVDGDIVEDDH